MAQENFLSIKDISRELNTGTTFTKFLLKRFEAFLSPELSNGYPVFPPDTVPLLIKIKTDIDSGKLPSNIELELSKELEQNETAAAFDRLSNEDIRVSPDGLKLIKDLFNDISRQQERIALAHEKRAAAEERKAVAIEKRADAEEKKAFAMNNIANALQEMNRLKVQDPEMMKIAHHAADTLICDDSSPEMDPIDVSEPEVLPGEPVDSDFPDFPGDEDNALENRMVLDDLSSLIKAHPPQDTDDLSMLLDETPDSAPQDDPVPMDNLNQLLDAGPREPALDDLSLLVDDPKDGASSPAADMDDLASLIDTSAPESGTAIETDDLSKLIDGMASTAGTQDMDDLSQLVDESDKTTKDQDNLSLLIDTETKTTGETGQDDLSKLIDDPGQQQVPQDTAAQPMDDLSALAKDILQPSLKPDITPKENLEAYKAAVMKIILQLKSDGSSAQEATDRLNKDEVPTLSGKAQWSIKALEQIYRFIDSAA